jgi:hypothetical protein
LVTGSVNENEKSPFTETFFCPDRGTAESERTAGAGERRNHYGTESPSLTGFDANDGIVGVERLVLRGQLPRTSGRDRRWSCVYSGPEAR